MPKLILSRKGFDSGSGGKPNPIWKDRLIPFPIPQTGSGIRYDQLLWDQETYYRTVMDELGVKPFEEAHLDPDLEHSIIDGRSADWRPAFGQHGAALSHLRKEGVGLGDLFLFFGWFREVEQKEEGMFHYKPGSPDLHVLYGYLEVGEVMDLSKNTVPTWLQYHPHWVMKEVYGPRNAIFLAAEFSSCWPGKPGAGVFPFSPDLILTSQQNDNQKRSLWTLPNAFFGDDQLCLLSYHRHKTGIPIPESGNCMLSSAFRGQEFVCERNGEIDTWIETLM